MVSFHPIRRLAVVLCHSLAFEENRWDAFLVKGFHDLIQGGVEELVHRSARRISRNCVWCRVMIIDELHAKYRTESLKQLLRFLFECI